MNSEKFSKDLVNRIVANIDNNGNIDADFVYEIYEAVYEGILDINENNALNTRVSINSLEIIYYIIGEYAYSTRGLNKGNLDKFNANESIKESMSSVVADKYLSLSLYNHNEEKLTNKFLPPISSLELYVNLMSNIVSSQKRNDPKNTLIVDLLTKSVSIARCTINLLCDGYETEAMTMWRTLHECECILILLDKYQDVAINAYLKHMEYGLVYKNALGDKEKQDQLFNQMKEEMNAIGLKSKDIKKYIEYGWMLSIGDSKKIENFKLNFRDGLETLAGLHQYSQIYMTSSEILHSTPLLIYSNKKYFYYLTLLNLYESFFRIEEVFRNLFLPKMDDEQKKRYMDMRKLYFSQLISIHKRELILFKSRKASK